MHGFGTVVRLALKDYFHDRLLSACAVLGLAAVLAPLLVLFGVKSGIINTMAERLIEDPRNREVSPVGSGRYTDEWFAGMAGRRDVAFVIPQTRSIAANMILINRGGGGVRTTAVDLIPTGEGDALLKKWAAIPAGSRDVVLTEPAARRLGVQAGGKLTGRIGRSARGVKENASVDLTVAGVLPIEAFSREAAFVRLALLEAAEDYRDGFHAPAFGWPGKPRPAGARTYPSFRLYARSIYDVAELRDMLTDQGLEVYTRAEEIGVVRTLDRSFTLIFRLIAGVAVLGYFAAMASNFLATVNRKSRHLGVTRLIGFSTRDIVWFPVVQAITTSLLGAITAACAYYTAEITINRLFSQYLSAGEYVCRLQPLHLLAAMASTIAMAMLASAYAAYRVAGIEPSEVIRDV
ncbi:MAG: FtsX-like permease family protein [Desulfobacterales bacterium]|nr:FtsX-like permease family protein [Desulfobacterales bacterium]